MAKRKSPAKQAAPVVAPSEPATVQTAAPENASFNCTAEQFGTEHCHCVECSKERLT
jgi:hypothetical protein